MAGATHMIYFLFILVSLGYGGFMLWLTDGIRGISISDTNNISLPEMTIIVSARNEEDNLPHLIPALVNQTYPQELIKLIIVDDRSTDNTTEILEHFTKKISNLRTITINEN